MSVLDSVIRFKALEKAEAQTQQQSIMSIFDTFQKARQTSILLDMEKKKVDVDLAKSGLRFGAGGKIEGDPSLLEQLGKDVYLASDKGLKKIGRVAEGDKVFKESEKKDVGPYSSTAEWKKNSARGSLFTEYMKSLVPGFAASESKLDKYSPTWSKKEIVQSVLRGEKKYKTPEDKLDAKTTLSKLGLSVDDFYNWAIEQQPELAKVAFPAKVAMRK